MGPRLCHEGTRKNSSTIHHVYVGADVARDCGKARGPMLNSTAAGLCPRVPSRAMPKKPIQWEVYRPIKGSPGAFIGIVEVPDEMSALKTGIEEFGIINPEHQNRLFVRRVLGDDD